MLYQLFIIKQVNLIFIHSSLIEIYACDGFPVVDCQSFDDISVDDLVMVVDIS